MPVIFAAAGQKSQPLMKKCAGLNPAAQGKPPNHPLTRQALRPGTLRTQKLWRKPRSWPVDDWLVAEVALKPDTPPSPTFTRAPPELLTRCPANHGRSLTIGRWPCHPDCAQIRSMRNRSTSKQLIDMKNFVGHLCFKTTLFKSGFCVLRRTIFALCQRCNGPCAMAQTGTMYCVISLQISAQRK